MSAQLMMPATPGTDQVGLSPVDLNDLGGPDGSSLGQSNMLGAAFISALVAAFEEMMSGEGTGQDGSSAPASQGGAGGLPFRNGSAAGLPADSGSAAGDNGSQQQNVPDFGLGAGSSLALDVLARLASAVALQMPDGSPSSQVGGPGGAGSGAPVDPGLPISQDTGASPPPAQDIPGSSDGGQAGGGNHDAGGGDAADGSTISVDGAKPGGDSVNFEIDNDTGKDEKVALTNSQNQKFSVVDLKPGQKVNELLDPNDPNTKSARLQTLNPDGSLQQDPKLTEFNLQPGQTAIDVSNNNFAGDYGLDGHAPQSLQETINDNEGGEEGDGTVGGDYDFSAKDQTKGPGNPMTMGEDPSKNFTITLGDGG